MDLKEITEFAGALIYYLVVIGAISINSIGVLGTFLALFAILIPIVFGATFLIGRLTHPGRTNWKPIMLITLLLSIVLALTATLSLAQVETVS